MRMGMSCCNVVLSLRPHTTMDTGRSWSGSTSCERKAKRLNMAKWKKASTTNEAAIRERTKVEIKTGRGASLRWYGGEAIRTPRRVRRLSSAVMNNSSVNGEVPYPAYLCK
jgi:hypothetical protein